VLAGRELADAFEDGLEASGLPLARAVGRSRTRVAFGAPLPLGIAAEHELADILLTEMAPASVVRVRVGTCLPDGWRLVDLFDVWLGAPPLAGQVAAADYRITFEATDANSLGAACDQLLAASTLVRERTKGTSVVAYDLRPLLADICVLDDQQPIRVRVRTRFDPTRGTGRPEEVVAALGDRLGLPLAVSSIVRECLILADELD
jgi:radical SAM-linked protein